MVLRTNKRYCNKYRSYFCLSIKVEEGGLYGKGEIFGSKEVLLMASISDIKIPLWEVFEVEAPEEQGQEARKQESGS